MEEIKEYMREIRDRLTYIKRQIEDMKTVNEETRGSAVIGNQTLCRLLGISEKTCYRYRQNEPPFNLPFHTNSNGTVYYIYDEVYKALAGDRIFGKGDSRKEAAVSRMRGFIEGYIRRKNEE